MVHGARPDTVSKSDALRLFGGPLLTMFSQIRIYKAVFTLDSVMADSDLPRAAREPFFNAPVLTLAIPAVIVGGYLLQVLAGPAAQEALVDAFGLNPLLLRQGHWDLL